MRSLFYFFIISTFTLCSCNSLNRKDHRISLIGKWHRFSFKNGYTEFDFDSSYVVFYNQKTGRFKYEYKIENDSFKYIGPKYAAKYAICGDSISFQGNDGSTATLYKFKEKDTPFESIPEEQDSLLFNNYRKGFDKRAIREYEKAGFEFSDPSEQKNDTTQIFQQLLKLKKH